MSSESTVAPTGAAPLRIHMTGSEWYSTSRGGLSRYFSDLYAALARRADVDVTATAFGPPDVGGSTWGTEPGRTAARIRASRNPAPRGTTILDRHFALFGPPPPPGARLVTHFHGPWSLESAAHGQPRAAVFAKRLVELTRYRRSAHFVVLAQPFADMLSDRYRVDPAAVSVIPPGVDLERFTAAPIPDGPPRVLCVRRLERRMGLDVLVSAWPKVLAAVPDARLDIAGKGSIATELGAQIADLGIGDSVTLLGETTDAQLEAGYRAATVTVVPTRSLEGFGLIALESLASGRAPIVTDVGGLPDSVRGFAPDLVVAPEDPDALGDRLARALTGDRPTVEACRAHAETFTWDACAESHVALYRELAK